MPQKIYKSHHCETQPEYTKEEWKKLPFDGYFDKDEDDDKAVESRRCICGSTIAVARDFNDPVEMKIPFVG